MSILPSPLNTGISDRLSAVEVSERLTLSSRVAPVIRSQRKTSGTPLASFGTRLLAALR